MSELPPHNSQPSTPKGGWEPPSAEYLGQLLPQYDIECLLGRGGMGAVYKGTQKSLDRPVAIKILPAEIAERDPSFAERFKNEALAMAKLNHPGIVEVYQFGETSDHMLYIVMQFVDGTDVQRMMAKHGCLKSEHALAITAHVCDALAYAHARGIVHRDIKPANIMVGHDGVVKVADFGLAKMSHSGNSGLTQSGMAMGTLHYMAPEALVLGTAVDHRADLYAVGVMLYQMLTGKLPKGLFQMPSKLVAGLDPRFDDILLKALREDRDIRHQSASELRSELDHILTQPVAKVEANAKEPPAALPTQARPKQPPQTTKRPLPMTMVHRQTRKPGVLPWLAALLLLASVSWMMLSQFFTISIETEIQAPSPAAKPEPPPAVPAASTPASGGFTPASLLAAKKRGGRLRLAGVCSAVPMVLQPADDHDDYVEVFAKRDVGWAALRSNGDLVFCRVEGAQALFGVEKAVRSVSLGAPLTFVTSTGGLGRITNQKVERLAISQHADASNGLQMVYGSYLLDTDGDVVREFILGKRPDLKVLPADFFKGTAQVLSTGWVALALFPDKAPRGWALHPESSREYEHLAELSGCIQADSSSDRLVLLRNRDGKVFASDCEGPRRPVITEALPPPGLPPAIRVRGGSALVNGRVESPLCAAQTTDGSWRTWGKDGVLSRKVEKLGAVLDLDATSSDDTDGFLIWIEPVFAGGAKTAGL